MSSISPTSSIDSTFSKISLKPDSSSPSESFPTFEEFQELRGKLHDLEQLKSENADLKQQLEEMHQLREENYDLQKELFEEKELRDEIAGMLVKEQMNGHARWMNEVERFKEEFLEKQKLRETPVDVLLRENEELKKENETLKWQVKPVEEALEEYKKEHPTGDYEVLLPELGRRLTELTEEKERIEKRHKETVERFEQYMVEHDRARLTAIRELEMECEKVKAYEVEVKQLKCAKAAQDNIMKMMDLIEQ